MYIYIFRLSGIPALHYFKVIVIVRCTLYASIYLYYLFYLFDAKAKISLLWQKNAILCEHTYENIFCIFPKIKKFGLCKTNSNFSANILICENSNSAINQNCF